MHSMIHVISHKIGRGRGGAKQIFLRRAHKTETWHVLVAPSFLHWSAPIPDWDITIS